MSKNSIEIDFSELTPDFITKNTLDLPEEEGVGRMRWDNPTEPHPPISANGKVTITDGKNIPVVLDFVYTYYQEIDKHYAHHCDLTKKGYLVPAGDLFTLENQGGWETAESKTKTIKGAGQDGKTYYIKKVKVDDPSKKLGYRLFGIESQWDEPFLLNEGLGWPLPVPRYVFGEGPEGPSFKDRPRSFRQRGFTAADEIICSAASERRYTNKMKSYCYLGHKIGIDIFEKGFNDIDRYQNERISSELPYTYNKFPVAMANFLTSKKWRPPTLGPDGREAPSIPNHPLISNLNALINSTKLKAAQL